MGLGTRISPNVKKEALILGVLLLNGFLLPSYLSLTYMSATLLLMLIFLKLDKKKSFIPDFKKYVSITMLAFSVLTLLVDLYFLMRLPYDISGKSAEEKRWLRTIGISLKNGGKEVDTLLTFLPKLISIAFASQLIGLYSKEPTEVEGKCELTAKTQGTLLNIAVYMIALASCIVQSVVQLALFSKEV
jgi:hypothetical protein